MLLWKGKSITYFECVFVALGIQHAMHMHCIILSCLACPAVPFLFPTLSHHHEFWIKVIELEICVLIFSANSVSNISHSKKT